MSDFKLTAKQAQRILTRLEDLEKRVRILEKGQGKPAPAPAPKETSQEAPPPPPEKKAGFLDKLKGW